MKKFMLQRRKQSERRKQKSCLQWQKPCYCKRERERERESYSLEKSGSQGITLVALVITIIILLILAGISLNFALGDNGILKKTQESKNSYQQANKIEQQTLQNIENYLYNEKSGSVTGDNITDGDNNSMSNNTTGSGGATWTSFTTVQSGVGYYGDLDGDGKPEGIIYADLAFGGNGTWGTTDGTYVYGGEDGDMFRPYWVSQNVYDGPFGKKEMVTPKNPNSDGGITTGEFRFYMMALQDIDGKKDGDTYCWYNQAFHDSKAELVTSTDFGEGTTNTDTMMSKWENKIFGDQNTGSKPDLWGQIKTQVANGWFVPSRGEWAAFADVFSVSTSTLNKMGLSDEYWTSSQKDKRNAWDARVSVGHMSYFGVQVSAFHVRMSKIF